MGRRRQSSNDKVLKNLGKQWRQRKQTSQEKQETIRVGLALILILFGVWLTVVFVASLRESDGNQRPLVEEDRAIEEKARVMRDQGFTGSDRELARGADKIRQFNEVERQRAADKAAARRKVLGE